MSSDLLPVIITQRHKGTKGRTNFSRYILPFVSPRLRAGSFSVLFFAGLAFAANAGLSACAPQKLPTATLEIERAGSGSVAVVAEIARTEAERSQGLMQRKQLPDGEGMLFVFDRDQQLSFWMKDTLIPLSIAFIASSGRIIEIKDMQPQDLNSVKSSRSARYALEVPQGWFSRAGVKAGDTVKIDF